MSGDFLGKSRYYISTGLHRGYYIHTYIYTHIYNVIYIIDRRGVMNYKKVTSVGQVDTKYGSGQQIRKKMKEEISRESIPRKGHLVVLRLFILTLQCHADRRTNQGPASENGPLSIMGWRKESRFPAPSQGVP